MDVDDLFSVFDPAPGKKRPVQEDADEESALPAVKKICFDNEDSGPDRRYTCLKLVSSVLQYPYLYITAHFVVKLLCRIAIKFMVTQTITFVNTHAHPYHIFSAWYPCYKLTSCHSVP